MSEIESVGVIGSGAWGTALALACARAGRAVSLWSHEPSVAQTIQETRENRVYLPGVTLPDEVAPTTDLADIGACDLVLAVAPSQQRRERRAPRAA